MFSSCCRFFFNDTATTEIYTYCHTPSLHDALPISDQRLRRDCVDAKGRRVAVAIGGYERQAEGREVVGFGQGAVDPGGKWAWSASLPAIDGGRTDRLFHPGPEIGRASCRERVCQYV